jgi:hypothetical protein
MSLPTIVAPEYTIKLYSQKQPIKYRPYLVKEEKLLLMAQQANDPKEVEAAVKQIIRNCTFDKLNVDVLPTFDLEFLFLQLRARSVNSIIEVNFTCQNKLSETAIDEKEGRCGAHVPVEIAIDDIQLQIPDEHTNTFWINDDIGVSLLYPNASMLELFESDSAEHMLTLLSRCLETVYTKSGDVYEVKELTETEVRTFIESLTLNQVAVFQKFFETMPRLAHTFPFKCPKCGYEEQVTLSGLMDFFD